jgi:hypothetical protein
MDQGFHYEVDGTGAHLLLVHRTGSLRVWDPVIRRGRTTPAQKG